MLKRLRKLFWNFVLKGHGFIRAVSVAKNVGFSPCAHFAEPLRWAAAKAGVISAIYGTSELVPFQNKCNRTFSATSADLKNSGFQPQPSG
jgi:hypothetical protein